MICKDHRSIMINLKYLLPYLTLTIRNFVITPKVVFKSINCVYRSVLQLIVDVIN